MSIYTGNPANRQPEATRELPVSNRSKQTDPSGFRPDRGLVDAVNVALLLGQPLLLTGEPGTGKTQLASSVAWELGFDSPLMFETKSTHTARDLFYTYDTLGRFHAAQTGEGSQRSLDYMTYNALGIAILRSNEEATVKPWLPDGFVHGGRRRSVVLVDEVDKAPRDFPNDLLNEVEDMYFKVMELGNVRISATEDMRPILIITSNSEKHLPDAFLRRCVYYNIPFPDKGRLKEIVLARIGGWDGETLLSDALDFFSNLRQPSSGLHKPPATAELLGWLTALRGHEMKLDRKLKDNPEVALATMSTLVKNVDDQNIARTILTDWLK
ncbi:MAG TPA: MoxR family ATPase [Pyrinomonadaceae bacterium]|nr:MoxR family ATPase [Pyrinomonadaceae bacterium]